MTIAGGMEDEVRWIDDADSVDAIKADTDAAHECREFVTIEETVLVEVEQIEQGAHLRSETRTTEADQGSTEDEKIQAIIILRLRTNPRIEQLLTRHSLSMRGRRELPRR